MDKAYRTLRPAEPVPVRKSPRDDDPTEDRLSKRRKNVHIACNNCRLKKTACDAGRPSCDPCKKKSIECTYRDNARDGSLVLAHENDTLRRALQGHAEMLELLVSLPEDEAFDTLRRLRATRNLSRVLAALQGSMDGKQRPSLSNVNRAMSPPTESDLESELMDLHPIMYPRLAPLQAELFDIQLHGESKAVHLQYEAPLMLSRNTSGSHTDLASDSIPPADFPGSPHSPLLDIGVAYRPIGPSPTNSYCDRRLEWLNIGFWTDVDLTDDYAASLISLYLEKFHPVFPWFDADLFLTDLVECNQRFCSTFLVNAVLFNAAQQYAAVDIRAAKLVGLFLREGERLWDIEKDRDSVLTVGASQIFSQGCHTYGPDYLGQQMVHAGRQMAERLGLVGVPNDSPAAEALKRKPPDWKRMAAYVAWGCYSWFSTHCFYYLDAPIEHPPSLPIPASNKDVEENDDIRKHISPWYMGRIFAAQCNFWYIAQEMTVIYYKAAGGSFESLVPLSFVEAAYQKLLSWTDTLSHMMIIEDETPEHVLLLHIKFHSTVVQIFQPFIHTPQACTTFSCTNATPKMVLEASINQLKRLSYMYYMQYKGSPFSSWYNSGLIIISQALLKDRSDPNWRLYLSLCIRAWLQLNLTYPIYAGITQGFLAMAIRDGAVSVRAAKEIMTYFGQYGRHHKCEKQPISTFITGFDAAQKDSQKTRINTIAETFNDIILFKELLTDDDVMKEDDETAAGLL